ncbi:DUF1206 domain-containing protein [Sphingomonas sp. BN140010]|uniref:DUF1206 domain-containing protein n=1 Tax=Sphingomonas arvum TaxID=2992113 RepID=A0ABT3JBE7_9SPHN|nr:DUF1206 domain-containing protein [Sphingomonas sp. BN140010]MCW3796380.1 DUF1206 domain-containing protein [Sphingomonas sp. BN140010]
MATDPSATLTTLARLGFAARGLLYLVIAYLVLTAGRTEDPAGALGYLASGAGWWLLVLITAGFVAYGVWRLSDAAFNIERHEAGRKGLGERIGAGASGIVHLFLAWQAVRLLRGAAQSNGNGAEQGAETALHLPGGQLLLIVGGLVLLGVGIAQLVQTYTLKFCQSLDGRVARKEWVKWTGRGGYAARGLVFLITGYFLLRAGFAEQASRAGGMQEALAWLTSPWDTIVALGLALFGIFSLVEARYRVIHDVPVEGMARQARAKLPV